MFIHHFNGAFKHSTETSGPPCRPGDHLKAVSHIACLAPAMPCRKWFRMCLSQLIYTVPPCLIATSHALAMPFFSRPRHSTAVARRPVGCLPAFGFFHLPRGVPRRLLTEAYQSSQRSIPTTVKSGSSTLQKKTIC